MNSGASSHDDDKQRGTRETVQTDDTCKTQPLDDDEGDDGDGLLSLADKPEPIHENQTCMHTSFHELWS